MRRFMLLVGMILMALAPVALSGPIDGGSLEVLKGLETTPWKSTIRFRGGERAAVLVRCPSDSKAQIHVAVHDAKGNLVTEAAGKAPPSAAVASVFWYPPRDGEYSITVKNNGGDSGKVIITVK